MSCGTTAVHHLLPTKKTVLELGLQACRYQTLASCSGCRFRLLEFACCGTPAVELVALGESQNATRLRAAFQGWIKISRRAAVVVRDCQPCLRCWFFGSFGVCEQAEELDQCITRLGDQAREVASALRSRQQREIAEISSRWAAWSS